MFSKACQYALRAVLYLAAQPDEEVRVGVKEIADELEIPKHFLAKVLQSLTRDNLVSSVRGPGGGFYLSEENRSNSLFEIILCIDGDNALHQCVLGKDICSDEHPCPFHFQVVSSREGFYYQLKHSTIEQFSRGGQTEQYSFL